MNLSVGFNKILDMETRIRSIRGGTSAGKTYSILQYLIFYAINSETETLISIVSESLPHLRRGAMRDFFNILKTDGYYNIENHDRTNNMYRIQKTVFEFFGCDQPAKLRGPRRDILFMNECNNIAYESFEQLEMRTKKFIFLDYNPTSEFWVQSKILNNGNASEIVLTYKDNSFLDPNIVETIKKRKPIYDSKGQLVSGNPMWWRVYGEGQMGTLEGVIFENWRQVEPIPENAKLLGYGQDFGYSKDPSACVEVSILGKELFFREIFYRTKMLNSHIIQEYEANNIERTAEIVADSAEPKSIEEIYRSGWNIHPAEKGKDSVLFGINLLNEYQIHITSDSVNLIKEFRNYTWAKDKNGNNLDRPIDDWNHGIDAIRYLCTKKLAKKEEMPDLEFL